MSYKNSPYRHAKIEYWYWPKSGSKRFKTVRFTWANWWRLMAHPRIEGFEVI